MRSITRLRMAVAGLSFVLATACVSFGGEPPPPSLFNITSSAVAAPGSAASGTAEQALAVIDPGAPAKINVLRVPVQMSDSSIAYLQDQYYLNPHPLELKLRNHA